MSHVFANVDSKTRPSDRRVFRRQPVRSLAYVELGEGNGGIVLNVSEGGLAVQAVMGLRSDELPCMRLQLAHSKTQIEAKGRIAWTSEFRKLAGVEFVDLSAEARNQIREWVSLETPEARGTGKTAATKSEPVAPVVAAPAHEQTAKIASEPPKIAADPEVKLQNPARLQKPTPEPASPPAKADDRASIAAPRTAPVGPEPKARSLASTSPPPDRYGFKPGTQAQPLPSPESAKAAPSRRRTAALVGTFAVVSLVVGWVAGRAGLRGVTSKNIPDEDLSLETATEPAVAPPNVSEIEVVDANNQRWLIPFNGPITTPKQNPPGNAGESTDASSEQNSGAYQASSLPSPIRAKNSSAISGDRSGALPAAPPSSIAENVSRSPLTADSHASISAASPAAPATDTNNGALHAGELVHRVDPVYPPDALARGIEGAVKLDAVINQDGTVKTIRPLSGPKTLFPAATDAVRQWRYNPTLVDGRPVQIERQITITFQLAPAQSN